MRKLMWLLVFGLCVFVALMTYVFVTGPRMYVQSHFRTLDAAMPGAPSNSVPLAVSWVPPPSAAQAAALTNPVADTAENRQRGGVYYEYYCLACHGAAGDGAGPVGRSYVPAPADLRAAVPTVRTDGELVRRMLTGVGHEPVLERVVHDEYRWYLVRYLRGLRAPPEPAPKTGQGR